MGLATAGRWPSWPLAVVIATGPSLTQADVDRCRGVPVIAVNNAYQLAPWADLLYACDGEWWAYYQPWKSFRGRMVTQDTRAARTHGLEHLISVDKPGFSTRAGWVHQGGNSGFQATNLALHCAERVVLLGFDMRRVDGRKHYFGDHPGAMNKASPYPRWVEAFEAAAPAVQDRIVNCTPGSALTCFPQLSLDEALRAFASPA